MKAWAAGYAEAIDEVEEEGLHPLLKPFWADLPHANIFSCFQPDLLHQIHKGVFKYHVFSWCQKLAGKAAIDQCYKSMPPHPLLQHFNCGISGISQWTGTEAKHMEKVFVGAVVDLIPSEAMKAITAILDFIYLAQYKSMDVADLDHMDAALATFHEHKAIFVQHGIQDHFNIPKLYPENVEEGDSQHDEEVIEVPHPGVGIEAEEHDSGGAEDLDMDLDDESVASDDSEEAKIEATIMEQSVYDFAKTSPLPKLTSTVLSASFRATKLLPAVQSYLESLGDVRFKIPTAWDCFDVYKRVTFCLGMPGDPETVIVDQV
ncbi:hypothetical protein FRB94_002347 [Tulasnella sp. JGI-2019a]|nr:hypothetical protein FRB94_002347 [Tulasnella sp. JGI-2019a]